MIAGNCRRAVFPIAWARFAGMAIRPRPPAVTMQPRSARSFHRSRKRDKPAEAWAFLLAQQDLVQAGKPIAQFGERVALADFVNDGLDRFGIRAVIQSLQRLRQIGQRFPLEIGRMPILLLWPHEIAVVGDGVVHQFVEERHRFRRCAGE